GGAGNRRQDARIPPQPRGGVTMARPAALRLLPVAAVTWALAAVAILAPAAAPWVALALWLGVAIMVVLALRLCTPQPRRASRPVCAQRTRRRSGMPRPTARRVLVVVVRAGAAAAASVSHVALAQPARAHVEALAVDAGRAVELRAQVIGKVERRA